MKRTLTSISVGIALMTGAPLAISHDAAPPLDVPADWQPRARTTAVLGGAWSAREDWPVLAVHALVLPTGNVLAFDATPDDFDTEFDGSPLIYHDVQRNETRVTVWNPDTNTHTKTNNDTGADLFCAGSTQMTDGRVLFVGGDSGVQGRNGPLANSNIYDSWTNTWTQTDYLDAPRWYSSVATMSNGEILTFGGAYSPTPMAEIFQFNKQWRNFEDGVDAEITFSGDYSWLQTASDGSVVYLGPHNQINTMYTKDVFGEDKWVNGPNRDFNENPGENISYRGYGSYAMYDTDKVLVSGGGESEKTSVIVDLKDRSSVRTAPMQFGRRQHNLTILADGQVLSTGGNSSGADLLDPDNGVLTPELWNPETKQWTEMNDMATDRQYHSVALLLPDARVLLAGSGYCIPCFEFDHEEQNAEIFSPPYLFRGERPVIGEMPERVNYDTTMTIPVTGGQAIERAHLIRMGSVTHSQNQDQRLVPLDDIAVTQNGITVTSPENRRLAPPGFYMLFVVDTNGVPSEAAIINVGQPLIDSGDVVVNRVRENNWEYYEVNAEGANTMTVNFNADLENTSLHVRNNRIPVDSSLSGFDTCLQISDSETQCVVTSNVSTRWYIGVAGKINTEFGLTLEVESGVRGQGNSTIAAPTNLAFAKTGEEGDYRISWSAVPGAIRYEIYRDGRLMNESDTASLIEKNLRATVIHTYEVVAVAEDESRSAHSDAIELRTSIYPYGQNPTAVYNPVTPSAPAGLRMNKSSATAGTLIWARSYDDNGVSGYTIYENGNVIGERADAGTSLTVDNLQPGVTYVYEVQAYDGDGNRSARSPSFTTTGSTYVAPDNAAPPLPAGFNPVEPPATTEWPVPPVETPNTPTVPVDVSEPVNPDTGNPFVPAPGETPDQQPVKRSGGGSLGLLGLLVLMVGGFARRVRQS